MKHTVFISYINKLEMCARMPNSYYGALEAARVLAEIDRPAFVEAARHKVVGTVFLEAAAGFAASGSAGVRSVLGGVMLSLAACLASPPKPKTDSTFKFYSDL